MTVINNLRIIKTFGNVLRVDTNFELLKYAPVDGLAAPTQVNGVYHRLCEIKGVEKIYSVCRYGFVVEVAAMYDTDKIAQLISSTIVERFPSLAIKTELSLEASTDAPET